MIADRLRLSVASLIACVVAGCASLPPPMPADVSAIDAFELSGRIAVRLEERGYSARMRWQHRESSDEIWLYTPVGSVMAKLTADAGAATLVTAERETYRSGDVQALTRDVLGWDLPLAGLQHWVLGRADPGAAIDMLQQDERARMLRLQQRDWTIDYLAYAGDGLLPSLLALQYESLRMRLVIDRWQLAGP